MARVQTCPYCGNEMRAGTRRAPTIDHVVPKALGGTRDNGNKLSVCRVCNEDKGSLALDEWHSRLELARDPRSERVGRVVKVHRDVAAAWPHGGGDLGAALRLQA